ncbi:hypothetical protein ACFQZW_12860 [Lutibacter aestuarii]|uniref:Uncharacterized protein n=1 Tax=Lutibacter aestuarii TaxID=861111 RepID=A0ABW2ZCD4_9FLAO
MTPIIDKILSFTISKKLSVFIIATFLIFAEKLSAEQWVNIAMMYIGTQGAIDILVELIKARKTK